MEKEPKEPSIIIDIGAGRWPLGFTIRDLKKLTNKIYIAIDISQKALMENREAIQILSNPKTYLQIMANGQMLPIKNSSVDQVFLANFLGDPSINFETKINTLKESYRIIKPKGLLKILEVYTPFVALKNVSHETFSLTTVPSKQQLIQKIEELGFKFKRERQLETHQAFVSRDTGFFLIFQK